MSRRTSAGILLYRNPPTRPSAPAAGAEGSAGATEILIVHPGGPLFARKDLGAWSIPKGEINEGEEPLAAARREFIEEVGSPPPDDSPVDLGEVRLRSGKRVRAFALLGDLDADAAVSNTFEMQWPPRSGMVQSFLEVDRAQWFELAQARERLNPAQATFVDRLADILASDATIDSSTNSGET